MTPRQPGIDFQVPKKNLRKLFGLRPLPPSAKDSLETLEEKWGAVGVLDQLYTDKISAADLAQRCRIPVDRVEAIKRRRVKEKK